MTIHTASEGISLAKRLEDESAVFYTEAAQNYPQDAAELLAFAAENKRNIVNTERVYYGVISDAIEGSYAFNLEPATYKPDLTLKIGAPYADVLKQALKMEEQIICFYTDAASQSKSFMADVPRAFELLAGKRKARVQALQALAQRGTVKTK